MNIMKIKAYANWTQQEVISEAEFIKKVEEEYNNLIDNDRYLEWLDDNYEVSDIWNDMIEVFYGGSKTFFDKIRKDFEELQWEVAIHELTYYGDWSEVELEV